MEASAGVNHEAEEGEQYMSTGEDGRPYIAVRRRTEEEKEEVQGEDAQIRFNQWKEEDPK